MIVMVPGVVSLTAFFFAFITFVVLTIWAFKASVLQGVLCLVVPFFGFYRAFKEYTERGKRWIPIIFLGGFFIGILLQGLGWLIL